MKKLLILFTALLFIGCEKSTPTCWKCTDTYYQANKEVGKATQDYCDKTIAEIKNMEGESINISSLGQIKRIRDCKRK